MKSVAFVPIKLNSERLPGKNIKSFTNGKPLLSYILNTLKEVKELDDIYVFCSSEDIKEFIPEGVTFLRRDIYLDLSTTSFNEVIASFVNQIDADTYVLAHATAPFLSSSSISKCINAVNNDGYDSAFTVMELQEFLWQKGKPLNYSLEHIPRTQDLERVVMETCGLYVFTKQLIVDRQRRIGSNPCFVSVSKIEACDINTEEDFVIADSIFNHVYMHDNG